MQDDGRKVLAGIGIAAGAAAAVAAGACALVAPRKGDARLDDRWSKIRHFRYAHRGLYGPGRPENSLAAFRHAHELGFGCELDVHLTLDGQLAVIHDSNTQRVCGVAGTVEQMTLAELDELRLIDPMGKVTEEAIPTLDEVLRIFEQGGPASDPDFPAAAPLIVEIKPTDSNYELLCLRTMACLDAYDADYCVESFDPRVVAWLRQNRPEVIRGQLAENYLTRNSGSSSLALRLGGSCLWGNVVTRPDFVAYRIEDVKHPSVTLSCGVLGGHLVTWTIRSEEDLLMSEAMGGVGIFEGFEPSPMSTIK